MIATRKIRVLIVDDSATVRQALSEVLSGDPEIEIMGTASDPYVAVERIKRQVPDVITLDIEMPRMDGITFLRKLIAQHPIPVVICSTLTEAGSAKSFEALEAGAVEVIAKPKMNTVESLLESRVLICDAVKSAAHAKPRKSYSIQVKPKLSADVIMDKPSGLTKVATEKIVVVGASTGGTEALQTFLKAFPSDAPAILVVQHMPEGFTSRFAERLNSTCEMEIKEAQDGDTVCRGRALIAPGNHHMILKRAGTQYSVEIKDGPLVCRHRPSVDVLFRSAARYAGKNAIGVIMTGMGDDGARGMKEMKDAQAALNLAQDEQSCIVFGMPAEAIKYGGVDKVVPLSGLAAQVLKACR